MNRALLAAALALPIVALAAGIAAAEAGARGATVWRLPIKGYDPRDPVRGHYVRHRYDWQVTGNAALCRNRLRAVPGGSGARRPRRRQGRKLPRAYRPCGQPHRPAPCARVPRHPACRHGADLRVRGQRACAYHFAS